MKRPPLLAVFIKGFLAPSRSAVEAPEQNLLRGHALLLVAGGILAPVVRGGVYVPAVVLLMTVSTLVVLLRVKMLDRAAPPAQAGAVGTAVLLNVSVVFLAVSDVTLAHRFGLVAALGLLLSGGSALGALINMAVGHPPVPRARPSGDTS